MSFRLPTHANGVSFYLHVYVKGRYTPESCRIIFENRFKFYTHAFRKQPRKQWSLEYSVHSILLSFHTHVCECSTNVRLVSLLWTTRCLSLLTLYCITLWRELLKMFLSLESIVYTFLGSNVSSHFTWCSSRHLWLRDEQEPCSHHGSLIHMRTLKFVTSFWLCANLWALISEQ